jgi:hypothetical protein
MSGATVIYADAGEAAIGTAEYACANAAQVVIRLDNAGGTVEMMAVDAISAGALAYPADHGKISASESGKSVGRALVASTADGDIIEVIPFPPAETMAATSARSRAATALPTAAIWGNFDLAGMRNNPFAGSLLEVDFTKHGDAPLRVFKDTDATILPSINAIGELAFLVSVDNEEASAQYDLPITVSGGTAWAFECRVKVENITDNRASCVLGLQESHILAGDEMVDNGAAMADLHFLGIARFEADGDIFDFQYIETGSTDNVHDDDYITAGANTYFTFGMYYDGATIQGYVDGVAVGTAISASDIAAADFPTAAVLCPTIAVKGDNAADFSFTIDWLRVAQSPA